MESGKIYVVQTDDGPFHPDAFLSWDCEGSYYTTVDFIDEVNEYDFHSTVEEAESRAKDADSGTWGGWPSPMSIMEVLNFDEAVNHGEEPELRFIKLIEFKKESV